VIRSQEQEKVMADALKESLKAEIPPSESSAGVILNGRYMAPPKDGDGKIWARATALVQASSHELYVLWRDIESAPKWQEMITDVIQTGPKTSHWVMKAGDDKIEWDSEILADEPGHRIAWRSVAGDSNHAGEVVFEPAPGGRGTNVIVLQEFRQGKVKTAAETIFSRNPKQAVIENLRHFKAFAETGEIPQTEGQPHGPRGASGNLKASAYGEKIGVPPGVRKAS
jgi:uncharacterized membrane protein